MNRRDFLRGAGAMAGSAALASMLPFGCSTARTKTDSLAHLFNKKVTPLVDLHRHFEAGMSPETVAYLAQKNGVTQVLTRNGKELISGVDVQDPDSIRAYYRSIFDGFGKKGGFVKFLDSLGLPVSTLHTLEDLRFAAREQILEQARAGNIHTELRGSPYTYQEFLKEPATMVEVIEAIRAGIDDAYVLEGASGAPIACFSRNKADRYGQEVVDAIVATHSKDKPVGGDIAGGPEGKYPPAMFTRLMDQLREAGAPITIHAGEQSKYPDFKETPSSFVVDAVKKAGAQRIGHGPSLITDPYAMDMMRERGIHIECCPVSNMALGYVPIERHPYADFMKRGMSASLSTDDPLMFMTPSVRDIVDAYGRPLRTTPEMLEKSTQMGIEAAFVTEERKQVLREKLRAA